jgi:hypothetical protein
MVPWMLPAPAIWAFTFAANKNTAMQKKTANQRLTIPCGLTHGNCIVASNLDVDCEQSKASARNVYSRHLVIEGLTQLFADIILPV